MCGARVDPSACKKKCVANHSETCGGPNLVQLLTFTCTGQCAPKPTPPPAPTPALPGLADVCTHLPASERCSPEICSIAPRAHVQLEARTYYQDRALVLPAGARVVGAGINKTIVVNCGAPSTEMRGFILGNNTVSDEIQDSSALTHIRTISQSLTHMICSDWAALATSVTSPPVHRKFHVAGPFTQPRGLQRGRANAWLPRA